MMSPGRNVSAISSMPIAVSADVHHDRRARRFAGLDRQAQRFAAVFADGFFVQAHFDADADVAVVADRLGGAVANPRSRD